MVNNYLPSMIPNAFILAISLMTGKDFMAFLSGMGAFILTIAKSFEYYQNGKKTKIENEIMMRNYENENLQQDEKLNATTEQI